MDASYGFSTHLTTRRIINGAKKNTETNMHEFFQSMMGRKYYESDFPRMVKALEKIATQLESKSVNDLGQAIASTVNVIVQKAGTIEKLHAYSNSDQGKEQALAKYKELINAQSNADYQITDNDSFVYTDGELKITMMHSKEIRHG